VLQNRSQSQSGGYHTIFRSVKQVSLQIKRQIGELFHQIIAAKKRQGLYSKLYIEANKPRVFFFDGTNNKAMFLSSTKVIGGSWALAVLGDGGREIHFAYRNGTYQYTNLDEGTGYLTLAVK